MEFFKNNLLQLGLTEEESIIYIDSIETQATTVLEYAQNTGIPRTTVYLLVESLIKKGLLREEVDGKRKKYTPASPEELVTLAKRKEEEYRQTAKLLDKELSQIKALYNRNQGRPTLSIKQGLKGAKELFNEALQSDVIYMHFMSEVGRQLLGDIGDTFFESCLQKMIETKQIIRDTPQNITFKSEVETERNQVLLLNPKYSSEVDYIIYGETIAYITYKTNDPYIVLISDPQIAYFEKTRFVILIQGILNDNSKTQKSEQ